MDIYGITGNINVDGILSREGFDELNASQTYAANAVRTYWETNGYAKPYPLIIKPTGYGKSYVIDDLIRTVNGSGSTLLVVGTKEILMNQNAESLRSLVQEETGQTRYSILPDLTGPVILATWQGLDAYERSKKPIPEIGLAIVDEVHNIGTIRRLQILLRLNPKAVVGLTATAYRASGKYRDPESYGFHALPDVVSTLPECIDKCWLSPLMGLCVDTEVILPRNVMTGKEIDAPKLYRELRHHPDLFTNIAHEIGTRFLPSGMKTIIVVNRVMEEACLIYKRLEKMGFKVGLAVNQNAARQLEGMYVTHGSIERYKLPHNHPDAIQVLISPQVIGEGFDAPATECVVWASPTSSSLRYTQVMGRGARRCIGKSYCLVVDFVYLIEGFGYSMNFAQFFKANEIKNLEGGIMYVGPVGTETNIALPSAFTANGKVVSIVSLSKSTFQAADGWLTKTELKEKTGFTLQRIESALKHFSVQPKQKITSTGHLREHYPPETVDLLLSLQEWKAINAIATELGEGFTWVDLRIDKVLEGLPQEHTFKKEVVKLYHPEVFLRLQRLQEYQTGKKIAISLGVSQIWVDRRLPYLQSTMGEAYDDYSAGRNKMYAPAVVNMMANIKTWPSKEELANRLGTTAYTLDQILHSLDQKHTKQAILRIGKRTYFTSALSTYIEEEYLKFPPAERGTTGTFKRRIPAA